MEETKTYWFVAFSCVVDNNVVFASVEITLNTDIFIPNEIRKKIEKDHQLRGVVIINWKQLQPNQLVPKD